MFIIIVLLLVIVFLLHENAVKVFKVSYYSTMLEANGIKDTVKDINNIIQVINS